MIDAPDHAAQERGNRSAGAWLLVALLGIALSVVAGMMSYGYTTAQAEQRFADVVDYVATQSLSYDAFNSAYTTKNLIRVMEIAGETARDMERDGSVDNATLEQYADQFNVSALIVTDASGNLVSESSTDGVGYESIATYLKEAPVLEVAAYPLKSYTARITLADELGRRHWLRDPARWRGHRYRGKASEREGSCKQYAQAAEPARWL